MNNLVADRAAEWCRLKPLVLDSVSYPITKHVYNFGPDEFILWLTHEPRRNLLFPQLPSSLRKKVKDCRPFALTEPFPSMDMPPVQRKRRSMSKNSESKGSLSGDFGQRRPSGHAKWM